MGESNITRKPAFANKTIAEGATTSDVLDYRDAVFAAFQIPSAFTGTGVTIEGSLSDSGPWESVPQYSDLTGGTAHGTITCGVDDIRYIPAECSAIPYLRFVSNASETAERTIKVFMHT